MRLIDADALMEGYKQMGYDPTEHPEESYMEGWCKGFNAAVDHCIHHVIHAPTIEPQRMRGRWIGCDNSDHWKCSVCGTRAAFWFSEESRSEVDLDMSEWLSDFCPNCGSYNGGEQDVNC